MVFGYVNHPFLFYYDPAFANHIPPSGDPDLGTWFIPQSGSPNGCPDMPPPAPGPLTEMDTDIARGIYPYTNTAAKWDQQRQLLYKLVRYPELVNDDAYVEAFYTEREGSSARQYAETLVDIEEAFAAAPAISAALDSLYALHDTTISVILQLDADIGQDTVSPDENAIAALEAEQEKLVGINKGIAAWMETYAGDRNNALLLLETVVSSLPDTSVYEIAWKTLLYAAIKMGQGGELDSLERTELVEIATTCPAVVGVIWNAVLPFMPSGDTEPYLGRESDEGCIEERGFSTSSVNSKLRLSPNPATQRLTVTLPDPQGGKWMILDASGKLRLEGAADKGQSILNLNLGFFAPGLYFFQFTEFNGLRHTIKFVVVK